MGMTVQPQNDERLLIRGEIVTVINSEATLDGHSLVVESPGGQLNRVLLSDVELQAAREQVSGATTDPTRALASLYGWWMLSAADEMRSGALATKPIRQFAHQDEAVNRMLGQPVLRFLLGDEPGTGKTIMSGLYVIEARRRALIQGRVLVVCPAHLVAKWQRELLTYFGVQAGIVTSEVGRDLRPLREDVDTWLLSIDLYTHNRDVRAKVAGPNASWSLVIFDEAHRLTPTSQHLGSAQQVVDRARHVLLLTATPHRGREDFFRELMHLLDPVHYPLGSDRPCVPSSANFLRRMKEHLKDEVGNPLFPNRFSETVPAHQTAMETALYDDVRDYVIDYYGGALTIARIIYGKRAASSTAALQGTLQRRLQHLSGQDLTLAGAIDPRMRALLEGRDTGESTSDVAEDDERWRDVEDQVIGARSLNRREEIREVERLLAATEAIHDEGVFSKWEKLESVLAQHTIEPGNDQVLVFSEYVDTARWLLQRFQAAGFDAEILYGDLGHLERDKLQQRFLDRDFDILVSTDAGGEGNRPPVCQRDGQLGYPLVHGSPGTANGTTASNWTNKGCVHLSPRVALHDGRTCPAGNASEHRASSPIVVGPGV